LRGKESGKALRAPTFALGDADGPAYDKVEMYPFLGGPVNGVSSLVATSYEGGGPVVVDPDIVDLSSGLRIVASAAVDKGCIGYGTKATDAAYHYLGVKG